MLVSCQTRVLRIDEMSKDLQNLSDRVNSLTDQLVFQGMCWEHCSGLHRPPCLRYDDAGASNCQKHLKGLLHQWQYICCYKVNLLNCMSVQDLSVTTTAPWIHYCCQVELLNCMSAASKPEEAGEECFAQFGADWAPVQVRLCLCILLLPRTYTISLSFICEFVVSRFKLLSLICFLVTRNVQEKVF